jgi:outer membrane protein
MHIYCFFRFRESRINSIKRQKQWTLSECVQYALENNISIKQSQLEIESADANKLSAMGIFYHSKCIIRSSENTGLSFQ